MDTNLQGNAGTFSASVFDGNLDFSGSSGKDFGPKSASGSKSVTLTGSDMQSFVGKGTVQVSESAMATSTASGGGNVLVGVPERRPGPGRSDLHVHPDQFPQAGQLRRRRTLTTARHHGQQISPFNGTVLPHAPNVDVIPVVLTNNVAVHNDFGKLIPGSLSGYVYWDRNRDGVYDSGFRPSAAS